MSQVEVSNLNVEWPERTLLQGINMEVGPGTCVAITGPSGSGKTSLLNCLCGIMIPKSGSVCVNGTNLTNLGLSQRSAFRLRHIGMVFQFGELLPELTALENVALPLRLLGISKREAEQRADEWLERLDLQTRGDDHPDVLSGGEIQRIGIARALVHRPSVVLADEPTGALDEDNTSYISDVLIGMTRDLGLVVIIATHDPLVASKADRVLRLRNRQLIPVDSLSYSSEGRS